MSLTSQWKNDPFSLISLLYGGVLSRGGTLNNHPFLC